MEHQENTIYCEFPQLTRVQLEGIGKEFCEKTRYVLFSLNGKPKQWLEVIVNAHKIEDYVQLNNPSSIEDAQEAAIQSLQVAGDSLAEVVEVGNNIAFAEEVLIQLTHEQITQMNHLLFEHFEAEFLAKSAKDAEI